MERKYNVKIRNKKQVNGKNIIFVDSGNANIDEVISAMQQDGWSIDLLRATYVTKTGEKKNKDIPPDKIVSVQRKYNLDNWTFKASKGAKIIGAQMSNKQHLIAIKQSKGRAWQDFCELPVGNKPVEPMPVPVPQPQAQSRPRPQRQRPTQQPLQQHGQFAQERIAAEDQAAAALYADDGDGIPEITPVQKQARRAAARKEDNARVAQVKAKKHTLLLVLSIIEIFSAGIVFAGFALKDVLTGRKLAVSDPGEAERMFKEAKLLLVFGLLATVAAVVAWNLPALLR